MSRGGEGVQPVQLAQTYGAYGLRADTEAVHGGTPDTGCKGGGSLLQGAYPACAPLPERSSTGVGCRVTPHVHISIRVVDTPPTRRWCGARVLGVGAHRSVTGATRVGRWPTPGAQG